ncbi:non-ribosomal peptide synthetase [Xanthomonas euroxanthea]|uniref:non-ribosomal peptide synthetase n=1 Tax=Xanthomonas euroxanthea TaxID=2259622 RepID=UPI0023EE900D|nr:non-ribosomal peptide synthetase [Xanthomonas euroxanthea]
MDVATRSRNAPVSSPADPDGLGSSLLDRFMAQVECAPDAIALTWGSIHVTYRELQERAWRLAYRFQELGAGPGCIVGLCIERSPLLISSVLAVLRTGAAYLPIDPGTPAARIAFMLDDSGASLLLAEPDLCDEPALKGRTVVRLDRDAGSATSSAMAGSPRAFSQGALAYVIYTSGSTGQPKAVLVPQSNVAALFDASRVRFGFGPQDVWTLFHSYAFDFSVWEMWGALLHGGRLVIVPSNVNRNAEAFYDLVSQECVTVLNQTPSAFSQFMAVDEFRRLALHLRLVIFGGEALRFSGLRRWIERHGDTTPELVNMYGITETTVHVTQRRVVDVDAQQQPASLLGQALPHLAIHILDESLRPVEDGTPGELYVAGAGLAWGYLNRSSLTASRFIASPFAVGERLYRSGDMARSTPDGEIEYLGRTDQQIKLRGFRIELGEIEAALLRHPAVRQAVVTVRQNDDQQGALIAYVVGSSASASEIASCADESVEQWQALYQQTYEPVGTQCAPSFTGWLSSYTGAPIPEQDMRQWLQATASRILARHPQRLLEIGCGVGLVLEQLAPHCQRYVGTDLSSAAISRLRKWIQSADSLQHVSVHVQPAIEFAGLPDGFDTVVLNSVIQYFPGTDYLLEVLRQAVERVKAGGRIFIGDVRNHDLLEAFHASVQLARANDDMPVAQLRLAIDRSIRQEKELLVAPDFFRALPHWLPTITHVEILLKRGDAQNELNQYRYDVWLEVGAAEQAIPLPEVWRPQGNDPLQELDGYFSQHKPACVRLTDMPNARLAIALATLTCLRSCSDSLSVRELREQVGKLQVPALEPEALWQLGERHGYDVILTWSQTVAGYLSADLIDRRATVTALQPSAVATTLAADLSHYTNDPLAGAFQQTLLRELREHLRSSLPEHMLPSATILLPALPLTANGKVDKRRLPAPDERPDVADYAEPHTPLQRTLAGIFADVLRLDRVGLHDSFFELGGNSLLAMRIVTQLRSQLAIDVPLRAIFEHPAISGLETEVEQHLDRVSQEPGAPLRPRLGWEHIPLSFPQERLWFLEQLGLVGAAYHVPLAFRVHGALDVQALRGAVAELVQRHEMLRSRFVVEDQQPRQVIDAGSQDPLVVQDLSCLDTVQAQARVADLLASEAGHQTDLQRGPLFRARLLCIHDNEHVLILATHHLAADGWSHTVMFRELSALYRVRTCPGTPPLPAPALQYADYAVWQRRWLTEARICQQLDYWKRQLADAPDLLALPTDRPRPAVASFRGGMYRFTLPSAVSHRLPGFAREEDVTPFMVLLAAFQILLARWSDSSDIVVGTPTAGRTRQETEQLIGLFINTLALRAHIDPSASFREILAHAKETALAAYAHQDAPFEKVVAELRPIRNLSRQPIVQVIFALQNTPPGELRFGNARVEPIALPSATSKYDLTLNVIEVGSRLVAEIEYATDLFDATTIADVAQMYSTLLQAAMERPVQRVSRLPLTGETPVLQPGAASAPRRSVSDLFQAQAALTPHAPAIESPSLCLSYAELNARADAWALWLRRNGIGPGDIVAVISNGDVDTFVAMLAVIKAAAAYLPVNAGSPEERLRGLLEDACPRLVLVDASMLAQLPERATAVAFQSIATAVVTADATGLQDVCAGPSVDDLAYVIYTSGSTGRPKGVLIEHRGLRDLVVAQIEAFAITPASRLLQFATLGFDASVSEVFTALCSGACLCLPGRMDILAGDTLAATLQARAITHVTLPPSAIPGLVQAGAATRLETLVVAGEACAASIVQCWPTTVRFINAYGPTEATVCATLHLCDPADPRNPPIGKPLTHVRVYVLDDALQRVPAGIAGEIYIGGTGVARGYHGRPALTAERFLADPFADPGSRMYRTGDRGRLRPDGSLEFLGRLDRQLKVRGYRIEPGDVEAALLQQGSVGQALVLAQGELDSRRLIAYVVATVPGAVSPEALLAAARVRLPSYMVPSTVVVLEQFPLTSSGKIDQAALPPAVAAVSTAQTHTAPRTPSERQLAAIWVEVLGCSPPSVEDSFFRLGGHSLLATRAVGRIREAMHVDLSVRDFFAADTLEQLAKAVASGAALLPSVAMPRRVARSERMPLSSAQQSLWMLDRLGLAGGAYNMPITLRQQGRLDTPALQRALSELVRRHEVLRTIFVCDTEGPHCVIQPPQGVELDIHDLRAVPEAICADACMDLQRAHIERRFDLSKDLLLRARLLQCADQVWLLCLATHHIAADGWSIALLVKELRLLYTAFADHRDTPLPEPVLQYADYSAWQRERSDGHALDAHKRYWLEQLAGAPMVFELPADRARPPSQSYRGALHRFTLPADLHRGLSTLSEARGVTLYMTMLAAFNVLLTRLNGCQDVLIGSPIATRMEPGLVDVVGPLLNTIVLRLDLTDDPSFDALLARARVVTLDAYDHQALPFEHLVDELQPPRDLTRQPLVQVFFSLQNQPSPQSGPSSAWQCVDGPWNYAKYDLSLYVEESADGLSCQYEYATDVFDAATVERWGDHLLCLLAGALADPMTRVSRLPLLGEVERTRLLHTWNATARAGLHTRSIPELIGHHARYRPQTIAVSCAKRSLTYAELDRDSALMAERLQHSGARAGCRVGICVERSVELVVAMLAVLKSGAAYVPLDPAYPQHRLDYMVQDSEVCCILTDRASGASMASCIASDRLLFIDDPDLLSARSGQADPVTRSADSVAYIIYTSGSTGRPKGCVITDRGLLNLLGAMADQFAVGHGDRLLAVTPYSFDIAGLELLMPLLRGARTHICSSAQARDARRLMQAMHEVGPTIMQATPATWQMLYRAGWRNQGDMQALCGGEALPDALRDRLAKDGIAWNMYGPTETTIWSTTGPITPTGPITIGKPIANTCTYVLDAAMQPVPIGVEGDLYVGGHGVSRGYWKQPALTAQRFVADPFAVGRVVYQTGDRARWLADGCLQYLGRRDAQVKLRGFRIELGDVEAVLARHPGVDLCACAIRQDAEPQLVAAYVPAPGQTPGRRELMDYLRAHLPDHMIPVAYVDVPALPLTANGKIDRAGVGALADPAPVPVQASAADTITQRLLLIWQAVLGRRDLRPDDGFFEQGGTSLQAIVVAERIAAELHPGFEVTAIFEFGSIARLARHLESLTDAATGPEPVERAPTPGAVSAPTDVPAYYADSVAIIGMSCAFPGASNAEEFWHNLLTGKESIERVPDGELRQLGIPAHVLANPKYVPVRSQLHDRDVFDAAFFNVSERDAQLMDPQLRLLLMHSWRAIEDAGYRIDDVARTAVFATASTSAYHAHLLASASASAQSIEQYVGWIMAQNGTLPAVISNKLGLVGPSLFVHSNCSSSLSALDLAHRRLLEGEWPFALVAAARVASFEGTGYVHQEGMNFSSDGHLRAFDAAADGAVGGEGVAVLLLKRAHDAIADGDPIYAVLRATATNNDGGNSAGFYAPSVAGQRDVVDRALAVSGIDPESISYVEAHGTGTPLGDPIEIAALSQAYGARTGRRQYCGIGSVKTNIGHLDTAAGLAGCIKVALSLSYGEIPASLHFVSPNPALKLEQSPFFVVNARRRLQGPAPHRAAVSAMGVGGSNAHAILEACIARPAQDQDKEAVGPWLFPLSAHDPQCLRVLAQQLASFVQQRPTLSLRSLAYTLQVGRKEMPYRIAIVAGDSDLLQTRLRCYLDGESAAAGVYCGHANRSSPRAHSDPASAELASALARWVEQGQQDMLASLWVSGFPFDWRSLYGTTPPLRINAPVYPFNSTRFWLDTPAMEPAVASPQPVRVALFAERWEHSAATRMTWDHPRFVVFCDVSPSTRFADVIHTRTDVAVRVWPRTGDSVGTRFTAYASSLLDVVREAASMAPAMIQLVLPGDDEGRVCGALVSLLLSAKREYDRLEVQLLHLAADATAEAALQLLECEPPGMRELRCTPAAPLTRRFVPVPDGAQPAPWPWRNAGRYLITGGGGRLGLLLAREMAATLQTGTLVLVGRSEASPVLAAQVAALCTAGLHVEYRRADVSDRAAVQAVLGEMTDRYGGIDGILHAAGVLDDGYLARKRAEQLQGVLAPKVAGLEHLDACHGSAPLDFLICFGSIGGALGSAGQCDYAAANAFMRSFATARTARAALGLRQGRTLCIDWSYWRDGGMRLSAQAESELAQAGLAPLGTVDAMDALRRAWQSGEACVSVLAGERADMAALFAAIAERKPDGARMQRIDVWPDLASLALQRLIEVFSEVSKIDPARVDGTAPLETFSIDSIMIAQLNQRLTATFPGLPRTLFYQFNSLKAIGDFLAVEHAESCALWVGSLVPASAAQDVAVPHRTVAAADPAAIRQSAADAREPIAIIGLAGRYPQARSLDAFWENLRTGRDCIGEIPAQRWPLEGFFCEDPQLAIAGRMSYSKWGGFLEGFADFDPLFFSIAPAEALDMDPQERLFLQACWEALEDGNYTRRSLASRHAGRVGVFVGITKTGFELHARDLAEHGSAATPYTSFGSVANRVSYLLDLNGPSLPIDTMCSASLTAIHEACEHLLRDECEMALAGGVNLYLHPSTYVGLCSQRMLSTDGHCRSFGANATGFVPGEGVGTVLLKPLSRAQRDGDRIHGVILASGINHGGRTHGYTVPNPRAQRDLVQRTLARAGLDARDISYVEAHGTGTEMGDPIEVEGLSQAFATSTRERGFCALGSVKSNIGHLEAAAGIAGLTKVLLQFKHGELVPTLHSTNPNPNIDLAGTPFVLQHRLAPWTRPRRADGAAVPRTATVSSFGAGGANAFLVVQEAAPALPQTIAMSHALGWPALIVVSARRPDRLMEYAKRLEVALRRGPFTDADVPAIAATLQLGREAMEYRLAFAATSLAQVIDSLHAYVHEQEPRSTLYAGRRMGGGATPTLPDGWQAGPHEVALEAWSNGAELDWACLYHGVPCSVSLPTYPFAEEEYWPVAALRGHAGAAPAAEQGATSALPVDAVAGNATLLVPEWQNLAAPDALPLDADVLVLGVPDALPDTPGAVSPSSAAAIAWSDRASLRHRLTERPVSRVIWFVPHASPAAFDAPIEDHAAAVTQCVELLQELDAIGRRGTAIALVAVTRQSQSAVADDCPDPAHAAVVGLLRSAAKEYRHAAVVAADLPAVQTPHIGVLAALHAVVGRASVYAYRHGRWLRSQLTTLHLDRPRSTSVGEGVYILVGGAGHVGQHITEHLLRGFATVVWVGRRPEADVQQALSRFGGDRRLHYCQADAGNLESLRRLRTQMLGRHQRIDAVLVATTHFSRVPLGSLSQGDLHEAFGAKVRPAVALAQVFANDLRDGVIFLSSLVSFIGNREQSHYAAACAWQDAFARALSQRGVRARVMNWGYWTIDDPRRLDELREIGIDFIDAASGGWALDVLLSGPFEQLGFLRTHAPLAVEGVNLVDRMALDGDRVRRIPQAAQDADVARAGQDDTDPALREAVQATVASEVCRALGLDPALLDEQAMFAEFGLDSIIGLKVVRAINQSLGISLPGPCLFDHPNVDKLTAHILASHRVAARHAPVDRASGATAPTWPQPAVARMAPIQREPIAIIGMSGRFPQSDDVDELWRNLAAGCDLVEPATRWHSQARQGDDDVRCAHAGYIRDVEYFDPLFFRISRADALHMDPQQRLCLEESWKALENAGYAGQAIAGSHCGVYIGCSGEDYTQLLDGELPVAAMHGSSTALLSSRIAYHLDLHGPAMTVDTACSSGLVAVHLACQALWMDEIELAIAGGVHVQCTDGFHAIGSRAGMLSPDGRCFTFDERANGFVPADGVGIVVLKRLSAAQADGDHIVGIVKGSAINQDGTSNGLTAPSASAQEQLECSVYARFDIDVSHVQMAEAHGTGTVLGDPIEVQALTRAFRKRTDRVGYCAIGSVKSNMGHAAEAAGMAGLFKVLLSLRHRQLPPTLHYRKANPHIDFGNSPFFVNTTLRDWPAPEHGPRRAVLSAFGLSGTNAHLVIEEAPAVPASRSTGLAWPIALSARTPLQLRISQQRLFDHLQASRDLDPMPLSYTLLQGRQHLHYRWSCVAADIAEALSALQTALATSPDTASTRLGTREREGLTKQAERCIEAAAYPRERRARLDALGELFVRGATPDFAALFGPEARRIPLPTYPFARERYWLADAAPDPAADVSAVTPSASCATTSTSPGDELQAFIVDFLERALVLNPGELTPEIDLQELGADSLVSMRLMREIGHRYAIRVSGREVFEHSTVAALVGYITEVLAAVPAPVTAPVVATSNPHHGIDALLDAFEAGELGIDAMERLIEGGVAR